MMGSTRPSVHETRFIRIIPIDPPRNTTSLLVMVNTNATSFHVIATLAPPPSSAALHTPTPFHALALAHGADGAHEERLVGKLGREEHGERLHQPQSPVRVLRLCSRRSLQRTFRCQHSSFDHFGTIDGPYTRWNYSSRRIIANFVPGLPEVVFMTPSDAILPQRIGQCDAMVVQVIQPARRLRIPATFRNLRPRPCARCGKDQKHGDYVSAHVRKARTIPLGEVGLWWNWIERNRTTDVSHESCERHNVQSMYRSIFIRSHMAVRAERSERPLSIA